MRKLYLNNRLFIGLIFLAFLLLIAHFVPGILFLVQLLVIGAFFLLLLDVFLLFRTSKGIKGQRQTPEKLSNGDQNPINLLLENQYPFEINAKIIDEVPFQFQVRDTQYQIKMPSASTKNIAYKLRPVERGEYHFGSVNVYASTPIGLAARRYQLAAPVMTPVYPSYLQMRKYELLAISPHPSQFGIKKVRRIGQSMEFEQIKQYVNGDNYRHINWLATARKNQLMVNQFQDEKLQNVYSIIDKGRLMRMPFEGMTLVDYAINATLVISNIAIKKGDKAGMVSFAKKIETVLPASKSGSQMRKIQELLYNQKSKFGESDFAKLYTLFRTRFNHRSLVLLFTNFESLSGMRRHLPHFRKMAKQHVLVVVFFENTELVDLTQSKTEGITGVYDKIIAEKFHYEKKLIVKELNQYGIQSLLTAPENLTINTINKYLEIKARGLI